MIARGQRAQRLASLFGAERALCGAANSPATRTAMAAVGGDLPGASRSRAPRRRRPRSTTRPISRAFRMQRAVTPVAATSQTASARPDPIFRSLFQAGERTQPISPAVQELWGNDSSLTSVASATTAPSLHGQTPESARRAGSISSAIATARSAAGLQALPGRAMRRSILRARCLLMARLPPLTKRQ